MYLITFEIPINNLVCTVFRSCYGVWFPFNCCWRHNSSHS